MTNRNHKDICEIFGYASDDLSAEARSLWNIGACPFIKSQCTKYNHDQTIIYGTCSVRTGDKEILICPNRLYADDYKCIRTVAKDAFGEKVPVYLYDEFIDKRSEKKKCVVAIGQRSGREVKVKKSLSMDWILALIDKSKLVEYVGVEVQSIDITGNYRDAWHAYKNLPTNRKATIPSSGHGLNWANVHKRLIPQIIRKGLMYSKSKYVHNGLYFILPDEVYKRFEDIIGDIPLLKKPNRETLTVFTYELAPQVSHGRIRPMRIKRVIRFLLDDFSSRFISGPNLPSGQELDDVVKSILHVG